MVLDWSSWGYCDWESGSMVVGSSTFYYIIKCVLLLYINTKLVGGSIIQLKNVCNIEPQYGLSETIKI